MYIHNKTPCLWLTWNSRMFMYHNKNSQIYNFCLVAIVTPTCVLSLLMYVHMCVHICAAIPLALPCRTAKWLPEKIVLRMFI